MAMSDLSPEANRRFEALENEMKNVREQNRQALVTQTKILGTLERIDAHLAAFGEMFVMQDDKVSQLEKIQIELEKRQDAHETRIKTVVGTAGVILGGVWTLITFLFK